LRPKRGRRHRARAGTVSDAEIGQRGAMQRSTLLTTHDGEHQYTNLTTGDVGKVWERGAKKGTKAVKDCNSSSKRTERLQTKHKRRQAKYKSSNQDINVYWMCAKA
jgi:hypothetical protein